MGRGRKKVGPGRTGQNRFGPPGFRVLRKEAFFLKKVGLGSGPDPSLQQKSLDENFESESWGFKEVAELVLRQQEYTMARSRVW